MEDRDLQKQLDALAERVEALESRLTEGRPAKKASTTPPPPPLPPEASKKPVEPVTSVEPVTQVTMTEGIELQALDQKPETPQTAVESASSRSTNETAFSERIGAAFSNLTLENLVGGRLYAILGALLVIIAAGTLLKLAWDAELFDLLPDQLKCFLAAAFGGALVVSGEVARRKISAWASIGLTTAGLGVLYATSYAAWDVFEVVPASVGFILLVATSGLGIFLGARAQLLSVAALSLIGGYLSPLMFMDTDSSTYTLPVYLIALLLVGLILRLTVNGSTASLLRLHYYPLK